MFISPGEAVLTFLFAKSECFTPCKCRFLSRLFKPKVLWSQGVEHWQQSGNGNTSVQCSSTPLGKLASAGGLCSTTCTTFFSYLIITETISPPSLSPIPSPSLSDKAIVRWPRPFLWIKRQHTKWDHFLPIFLLLQRKSIGNVPFGSGLGSFSNFCCNRYLVCRHVDVSKAAV